MTRVGVALSGGGHRASVWAAGLLLYLADAGRNGDVGAIASVSGDSSPFEVPDAFAQDDRVPDRSARAREAIAWLGDSEVNRAAWAAVAGQSRALPTVLRKLG